MINHYIVNEPVCYLAFSFIWFVGSNILFLLFLVAMIVVGLIAGWLAGSIWKHKRPIGARGDYIAAVITAIAMGLLDWYVCDSSHEVQRISPHVFGAAPISIADGYR